MKQFNEDLTGFAELGETVITIGNFDGVHRGHQFVISRLNAVAKQLNAPSVAVTFEPHPVKVLNPDKDFQLVLPYKERRRMIARYGVDAVVTLPFTAETAKMPAEQWVREVLIERMSLRHLLIGYDFSFGRGRDGDAAHLSRLGEKYGFEVAQIAAIEEDERPISSSRVRRLVAAGEIQKTTMLLGRPYHLSGTIVHGDGRGRSLGYPTANLQTEWELIPHIGVYAAVAELDGEPRAAAVSVGHNPTFDLRELRIEAYLLDFDDDLSGRELTLHFVRRLRDEKKFHDVNHLIAAMSDDVERTRALFAAKPPELWLT
ncbi:MAG: bifunctional riboflavin kinase/FAD synthetase [Candidatus Lernaella stagnicola]|nr:bifunctional riboflavin kinase/FAD synthetase [Candidatus Lernaella stagnicola]